MAAADVFLCLVADLEVRERVCWVGEGVKGGGEGLPLHLEEAEVRMS